MRGKKIVSKYIQLYQETLKNYYHKGNKEERIERSPYVPTTVEGLDEILNGGIIFPYRENPKQTDGIVMLIKGRAGTGKTTLAAKILLGVMHCNKNDDRRLECSKESAKIPDSIDELRYGKGVEHYNEHIKQVRDLLKSHTKAIIFSCEQSKDEYTVLLNRLQQEGVPLKEQDNKKQDNKEVYVERLDQFKAARNGNFKYVTLDGDIESSYDDWLNALYSEVSRLSEQITTTNREIKSTKKAKKNQETERASEIVQQYENDIKLTEKLQQVVRIMVKDIVEDSKSVDALQKLRSILYDTTWLWCKRDDDISKIIEKIDEAIRIIEDKEDDELIKAWDYPSSKGAGTSQVIIQKSVLNEINRIDKILSNLVGSLTSDLKKWKVESSKNASIIEAYTAQKVDEPKYRTILIDGLDSFPTHTRKQLDSQLLIRKLRKASLLSIIVYEEEIAQRENLDYLADIVINLEGQEELGSQHYYRNRLLIEKSRFQRCKRGWQQYKITNYGVQVYPSIASIVANLDTIIDYRNYASTNGINDTFAPHDSNNGCFNSQRMHHPRCYDCRQYEDPKRVMKFLKLANTLSDNSDNNETVCLLERITSNVLKRDSSTIILGPRHGFKFYVALDFLRAGTNNGEHSLMLLFQDRETELQSEKKWLCQWVDHHPLKDDKKFKLKCFSNVHLFHIRPNWLTPADFMMHLDRVLLTHARNNRAITRLVLYDLVQLEAKFPSLVEDSLFLPTLINYLRLNWGITTVLTGVIHSKLSMMVADVVHNVVFSWRDKCIKNDKIVYAFYHSNKGRSHSPVDNDTTSNFFYLPWENSNSQENDSGENCKKKCDNCDNWNWTKDIERNPKHYMYSIKMQRRIWELRGLSELSIDLIEDKERYFVKPTRLRERRGKRS